MERQAGLGRSLEDVLDSLTPVASADAAPTHVLFGLGPDDAASTNGAKQQKKNKNKQPRPADGKSASTKKKKNKKKKNKKKKSKGEKQQR